MNLNNLSNEIHLINKSKGFWPDDGKKNIGEALMLIVSELSEALEADRHDKFTNREEYESALSTIYADDVKCFENFVKNTFEDELADALIRILDLCGGLNIDIQWHVQEKLKYNKKRPYKHGKKY